MNERMPNVVIVGGGFGGLAAAKALRKTRANLILIDRTNHHLFQPLLYQVATSVLTPEDIGSPLRGIFRKQKNMTVLLGEVTGVDKAGKRVFADSADRRGAAIDYDYLILATGSSHSYFGHDEFARFAPGLKSLLDAVAVRNRILGAFEQAEAEEDPTCHQNLLTFVLVGAGPTGVEMAAAIAVEIRTTLKTEFRRIDPTTARVLLVDRGSRVLAPYSESLSAAAKARLESLGVEVLLNKQVDAIDQDGVVVGGERIAAKTVIWTAGVTPSPAGKWLEAETDRAGRVRVQTDLSIPAHPEIFVVGDTASLDQDGKPLPGVAQVAMQQGRYAGRSIDRKIHGKPALRPFRYWDKGNLAVVGGGFAVLQTGKIQLKGFVAWLVWAGVHLQFLAQRNLRVAVFLQWVWTRISGQRGSSLILSARPPASEETPAPEARPNATQSIG
jgi:NADH dehydrogenase